METEVKFKVVNLLIFMDEILTLHIDRFNNKFVADDINYLGEGCFLQKNQKGSYDIRAFKNLLLQNF